MPNTLIPKALHPWSLSTNVCGAWATGTYGTVRKCYKGHYQGSEDSAIYFLAMRSRGVPLGAITSAFQEYDFTYNEAQMPSGMTYNNHTGIDIYIDLGMPTIIRAPVYDRETVIRQYFFIVMETPPSSCSPPSLVSGSSHLDDRQPCAQGMMTCQRLATALDALILLIPMLIFAWLDSQSESWKHASPLTVLNITDEGDEKNNARKICTTAAATASPRLPSEPAEDTPVYVISSIHGFTAHDSYWNGRALLQLCAQCQDRNGAQHHGALDAVEVEALARDIAWVENMLQEPNAWMCDLAACPLFRQLSAKDTERYGHLEVSRWQGHVCASVQEFFINNQSQLCPNKDGFQHNAEQLGVLRYLLPLMHYDFITAARTTQQMSQQ